MISNFKIKTMGAILDLSVFLVRKDWEHSFYKKFRLQFLRDRKELQLWKIHLSAWDRSRNSTAKINLSKDMYRTRHLFSGKNVEWFCQNLGDRFPHTNPSCFADSTGPYIVSRLCALVLAAASVASLSCLVSNFSKFLLMPCKNQTYFLFRRHCIRTSSFFVLACQLQVWKLMIFWKFLV